jgi:uncharacterized protein (TIGR04255 family)
MPTRAILRKGRAPVIYTVAQVQFAPILRMANLIPDIQEALGQSLPLFEENQEVGFRMLADGESLQPQHTQTMSWHFLSENRDTAVSLRTDSFVFHSSAYTDFEQFIARMMSCLESVARIARIAYATRYGLRYVDLMRADEDGDPSRHLVPTMLGVDGEVFANVGNLDGAESLDARLRHRVTEQVYQTRFGTLVLRVIENVGSPSISPDIMVSKVALPDMAAPQVNERFISIDTDHFRTGFTEGFNLEHVEASMRELHIGTSAAFFTVIRDDSVDGWVEKN